MAGLHPLPPTHIHHSTRLTHSQAHAFLSTFLSTASTHPEYRPDAQLSQHGISAAGISDGSNLTISHLERILKGIAGERVGGLEWNTGDTRANRRRRRGEGEGEGGDANRVRSEGEGEVEDVVEVEGADGGDEPAVVGEETGEWQDKEDWEHAQADVTEDLEGRDPAREGIEKRGEDIEVGEQQKMSKEERKLAKKERLKKDKQERAVQRQQKG